jgi:small subunit ribosomal protein S17
MPKKKTEDEVVETAEANETEETANEETAVEAQSPAEETPAAEAQADAEGEETAAAEASGETDETAVEAQAETEDKPKKSAGKKKTEATDAPEEPSVIDSVFDTVAGAVEAVAETVSSGVSKVVSAVTGSSTEEVKRVSKRAERIGIVSSDKMTKTVVVRVERQVKHPIYRKYIKRRKNFMAHDETGATIGDKVRIIETRPLSAKKRWRVVEIIQKAEK